MTMRGSSFDFDQALTLANQLANKRSNVSLPEPRLGEGLNMQAKEPSAQQPAPPAVGFQTQGVYRTQVWEALLDWTLKVSGSTVAFVCDGSGLVIADAGRVPNEIGNLPSIGVAALTSLHRCIKTDASPRTFTAKLDTWWFTLITITDGLLTNRMEALLLGLVSEVFPPPDQIDQVQKVFQTKLSEF